MTRTSLSELLSSKISSKIPSLIWRPTSIFTPQNKKERCFHPFILLKYYLYLITYNLQHMIIFHFYSTNLCVCKSRFLSLECCPVTFRLGQITSLTCVMGVDNWKCSVTLSGQMISCPRWLRILHGPTADKLVPIQPGPAILNLIKSSPSL